MKNTDLCVQSTMDYGMIKHIGGNRVVNPKNVKAIQLSMSEKQLIVPAILNEKMEIIDGQHRFAACERLGLPFYYIIVEDYNLNDVQRINANMANWTVYDFLDSFIDLYKVGHSEYSSYVDLKHFVDDTGLTLPTAIALSDLTKGKESNIQNFKDGNFEFKNKKMTEDLVYALKDFEPYDQHKWKQVNFALMFAKLYFNNMYSHDIMIRNLPKQSHLLQTMVGQKATLSFLIEIYNFKLARNKRLYANVVVDAWEDMLHTKKD